MIRFGAIPAVLAFVIAFLSNISCSDGERAFALRDDDPGGNLVVIREDDAQVANQKTVEKSGIIPLRSQRADWQDVRRHKSPKIPSKFYVDYSEGTLVKDGKPFRYISGSLHYSRVPHEYWADRLRRFSAMGLDAVQTYVPWNFHEPWPGTYDFSGSRDLIRFIRTAKSEGLLVLLRLGPYICGEWDAGGLPAWLFMENPVMDVRTNDAGYMEHVKRWWGTLLPKIVPYLYENGGPIVMVQVENEYGSFPRRDPGHVLALLNLAKLYLGDKVLYYTTDGNSEGYFSGGRVDGALTTVDFGPVDNPSASFGDLQKYFDDYKGPYVNSEFYTGWFSHWLEPFSRYPAAKLAQQLDTFLASNGSSFSVNMYMFLGGTTFGFFPGANANGDGTNYLSDPNSYDYDSPLTENGGCGVKCSMVRQVLLKHTTRFNVPAMPPNITSISYGTIQVDFVSGLLDLKLDLAAGPAKTSPWPLTFESLRQDFGFVLYEAVPASDYKNVVLETTGIADEAVVLVNGVASGIFSRQRGLSRLANFTINGGDTLSILVHSMGRINYGNFTSDLKGMGQVLLGGDLLPHWTIYSIPLNQTGFLNNRKSEKIVRGSSSDRGFALPGFFRASFSLRNDTLDPGTGYMPDSFVKLTSFTRGVVYLNGVNLGRFWNGVGPVGALYVPGPYLNADAPNELIVLELDSADCSVETPDRCFVEFVDRQILIDEVEAKVPFSRIPKAMLR